MENDHLIQDREDNFNTTQRENGDTGHYVSKI